MDLAMERTGSRNGAVFLWDSKARSLVIDFHVVDGLVVPLPTARLSRRRSGRRNGIAMWVFDNNQPYICRDSATDPHYAPYFLDVGSIAAVPIPYQKRAIGVISVSSREPHAFTGDHIEELKTLAASSAKFLRRAQLYRATRGDHGRPFLIKGLSPQWLEVDRRVEHVSPTDTPVLIHGESGTGKELVAHAIHFNSRRASRPFVTVNCAAIPESMLESILFGHVRGAFTGASYDKVGEFKKADGGTLFLDEVGELPMGLQAKVLRAVEQGEVQPLGSNRPPERVDVRLICATNRDLSRMTAAGTFRDDLYYRLSVVALGLPALRDYKDNLEVLSRVLLHQVSQRHGKARPRFSAEAMALLQAYDYPGNVRELKNAIEHAVIMSSGDEIRAEDLPGSLRAANRASAPSTPSPAPQSLRELREAWLAPLEKRYLSDLLAACDGNVREAARRAGVNAVTMYRLLRKRRLRLSREVRADAEGAIEGG